MKEGLLIPEFVALLILMSLAIGIFIAWLNMEEAKQVQYRRGCVECQQHRQAALAEAEAKAKEEAEAEKRRQEQHAAELAKLNLPPQEEGVKPPKPKGGGWAV